LRKRLADERRLPPYVIFHDSALRQMAASLPASHQDLLRITGVGQQKAADYGDIFLQEIAAYIKQTGAAPQAVPATPRRRLTKGGLNDTTLTSVRSFQEGHSIDAIAAMRGFARTTIEGHLADALEAGEELEMDRLLAPRKWRAIEAVMDEIGWEMLGSVMERLGEGYSYGELRLVRASYRSRLQES
jgi:ATP-dependent DNA helicase RecQ